LNPLNVRAADWKALKKANTFTANYWEELVSKTPSMLIAGYDANTRDVWEEDSPTKHRNLWHEPTIDQRIAPMALTPMGSILFSADNTYKTGRASDSNPSSRSSTPSSPLASSTSSTSSTPLNPDKKRPGFAKGGALDFVAIQNNTEAVDKDPNSPRYNTAYFLMGEEDETERDHCVVASLPVTLSQTNSFEQVRNYISAELMQAAPELSKAVSSLTHSAHNKELLLMIHSLYLSPDGLLMNMITPGETAPNADVKSPLILDRIEQVPKKLLNKQLESFHQWNQSIQQFFDNRERYSQKFQNYSLAFNTYVQAIGNSNVSAGDRQELAQNLEMALTDLNAASKSETKLHVINQFAQSLQITEHACTAVDGESATRTFKGFKEELDEVRHSNHQHNDRTDPDADPASPTPRNS